MAGGLAALGARLEPGFEVVAGAAKLESALAGADLVVTGEGRLDHTSLGGKVVGSVLAWTEGEGPLRRAVIAGQVDDDVRASCPTAYSCCSLTDRVWSAEEAEQRAALLAEEAAVEVGRWATGTGETRHG